MEQIPPLAWVAIIAIIIIFVVINLGLVAILRDRSQFVQLARRLNTRRPSQTAQTVQHVKEVLHDPFKEERSQLNELSNLVSALKEPSEKKPAEIATEPPDLPK